MTELLATELLHCDCQVSGLCWSRHSVNVKETLFYVSRSLRPRTVLPVPKVNWTIKLMFIKENKDTFHCYFWFFTCSLQSFLCCPLSHLYCIKVVHSLNFTLLATGLCDTLLKAPWMHCQRNAKEKNRGTKIEKDNLMRWKQKT